MEPHPRSIPGNLRSSVTLARTSASWFARASARSLVLVVLAAVGLIGASSPAVAQSCTAGTESDFDGDGKADLAIGDPDATVSGKARAGRVHIAYGDGAALTIDADDIPSNDNSAGERFGFSMASTDWNGDGCSDLLIGAPFETWASGVVESGVVVFIPGSPAGLDTALAKNWSQASFDGVQNVDTNEVGDRFGWDVAAGVDTAGEPFVVVGVPGQAGVVGGVAADDGGNVFYARPGAAVDFNQNSTDVADSFEAGDMFGYSVAASESGFSVGIPGESTTLKYVGTVNLFSHSNGTTAPAPIAAWGQNSTGISDSYEAGDMYGYSVDMVDYIPVTGTSVRMMIAVGAPGEAAGLDTGSGLSMVLWSPGTGITEYKNISQDLDKITGDGTERGDAFGAGVAMVNRTPGQNTSTDTLLMAVGAPGEDTSSGHDIGEVGLFSMIEDVSAGGDQVSAALAESGHSLGEGATLGATMHATQTHLWVTSTDPASPAVYGIPWLNIVADGTGAVIKYTPATFSATSGVASFGASLA